MVDPITILLGVLTFAGTKINQITNHKIQTEDQKVELMKEMCFQEHDCEPLKLYLDGPNPSILVKKNVF